MEQSILFVQAFS